MNWHQNGCSWVKNVNKVKNKTGFKIFVLLSFVSKIALLNEKLILQKIMLELRKVRIKKRKEIIKISDPASFTKKKRFTKFFEKKRKYN